MKRNLDRLMQNEIKRQKEEAERKGPRSVAKNPIIKDTRKTKMFNQQFMEQLGLVMCQVPELLGRGLCITRVSVMPDWAEVRVFWAATRRESEEEVSQLLEENAGLVRRLVAANSNLGQIPRLVFVLDNQYLFEVTMDKLFDKIELGPRDDSEEENAAGWEKVESLVLKNDVGGLRREEIMDAVHAEMEKKKALHRSQYTEEQFEEAYRETVENNRNSGAHRKEVENNIKTFLRSYKKIKSPQIKKDYE